MIPRRDAGRETAQTGLPAHYQPISVTGDYIQHEWAYAFVIYIDPDPIGFINAPAARQLLGTINRGDPVIDQLSACLKVKSDSAPRRREVVARWTVRPRIRRVLLVGMDPVPCDTRAQFFHLSSLPGLSGWQAPVRRRRHDGEGDQGPGLPEAGDAGAAIARQVAGEGPAAAGVTWEPIDARGPSSAACILVT